MTTLKPLLIAFPLLAAITGAETAARAQDAAQAGTPAQAAPAATPQSAAPQSAVPQNAVPVAGTIVPPTLTTVAVEAGQGRILQLDHAASNIFVADPKVAEVRPAGPESIFVFGNAIGRTSLDVLDSDGATVLNSQVVVLPSSLPAALAKRAISHSVPDASLNLRDSPAGLLMNGSLDTPDELNNAAQTAKGFIAPDEKVQNEARVRSGVQVSLQVSVAEMARQVTRQLGVNWQALGTVGKYSIDFLTANPLAVSTAGTQVTNAYTNTGAQIQNIIDALAQDNLARNLAEPNLTAMSGESASFLVGGEFPIPVAQQYNTITVAFKQYGISLEFVPTVLDSGRINLHVRTEVSALTNAGAVQLNSTSTSISIPAITVRRADTTVELGSGQSFAIAGLLQDQVQQADTGVPGLDRVPIVGALFRSTSFLHNKSELVVIVTPTIVKPVNDRSLLHTPDEDYTPPDDIQRNLKFDQTEARNALPPARNAEGFIVQ